MAQIVAEYPRERTIEARFVINVVEIVAIVMLAVTYYAGLWRFADVLAWLAAH